MLLPHRTFLAAILILALLTAGCGEMVTHLSELTIVQSELLKKFGEDVLVNATPGMNNGVMLMVWFVNSPLNEQSENARLKRAEQTAQIVKAKYARIQNVRELWVGFLRQKTRLGLFHRREVVGMHGFDKNAQPLPGGVKEARTQPSTGSEVTANYSSTSDVTDVSVSGIQLEGQPGGLGVTVLPFYKVPGDARTEKGRPPATVEFNFASYAEKPRFPQTVPIAFVADGKAVYKAEGIFRGTDAQFCYLHVPYKAFRRIVGGKELKIKLGDKEYPLTPSQLKAMNAMTEYVTE